MTYTVEIEKKGFPFEKFIYNNKDVALEVFEVLRTVSTGKEVIRLTEVETGEGITEIID